MHPVGMVSHRPFPGLPGEVGMARETRALPGVAAAWSRWWRFGREGPRIPVGTVSHRPFPGLSVPWAAGRGGDGPWDTGPTGGGSGLEPLVEIRAGRPAGLVGTVSHRPFRGLSVPWVAGRGGDGPWDTGPTGGGSGLGAAGGDSGREACWSGRDGVSPSVPWAVCSLGCRARWGWPVGHGPYRGWQRPEGRWWRFGPGGLLVSVGTVSHRPSRGLSVLWVVGRGGDGPWDTGPTGGGSGLGAACEDSGREAR